MRKYNQLKQEKQKIDGSIRTDLNTFNSIAKESTRVSNVSRDVVTHLDDLNKQFSELTKLDRVDVTFLFMATALQCARQYMLSNKKFNDKSRISSIQNDKIIKNFVPKKWHHILLASVPYDSMEMASDFRNQVGSIGLSGPTHRYLTLGHDPVLGWLFGTMNILSDSLTKIDFISTYHVSMGNTTRLKITGMFPGGTVGAFQNAYQQIVLDKLNLPAAITRQALHFGSDYFTKLGLPIPFLSSINKDLSKDFLTTYHIDMLNITRGVTVAVIINQLIMYMHLLFYNENIHHSRQMYEVRTRKILSYSNAIATSSNILYVSLTKDIAKLDLGGMLVTINRLISDGAFIAQIKKEFIEREFYKIVMGEDFN